MLPLYTIGMDLATAFWIFLETFCLGYITEVAVRTAVSVCRSFLADATAEPTWTAASCFILGCVSLAYVLTIHQGVSDVNTELQTFRKSFIW